MNCLNIFVHFIFLGKKKKKKMGWIMLYITKLENIQYVQTQEVKATVGKGSHEFGGNNAPSANHKHTFIDITLHNV